MEKTGIITFHSAYNYGSVLQAFATQEAVKKLGCDPEIINYRLKEQKIIYSNIRFKYGLKSFIRDLTLLPVYGKRKEKYRRFEDFFKEKLVLTAEAEEPEDVSMIWGKYPVIISGSDQIWNKHSLELQANDWKYMGPYLLDGYSGRKVSYASSTANMTDAELERIKPQLDDFSRIAMREPSSAEKISAMLGKSVESVLDPTFLLNKDEWIEKLSLKKAEGDYILFYSLGGPTPFSRVKADLQAFSEKLGCKVRVVTPFCRVAASKYFEPHPEYGPVDFMNAIYNAKAVVTDSYHGTILSVNFGKDVYSLCKKGGSEFRKTEVLERIGLGERILYDSNGLLSKDFAPVEYAAVYEKLQVLREHSMSYLEEIMRD